MTSKDSEIPLYLQYSGHVVTCELLCQKLTKKHWEVNVIHIYIITAYSLGQTLCNHVEVLKNWGGCCVDSLWNSEFLVICFFGID